ncbi:hypothetical protein T09_14016, partial [Trichinella sp. T9]
LETNATKEWHAGNIIPLLKVIYFHKIRNENEVELVIIAFASFHISKLYITL